MSKAAELANLIGNINAGGGGVNRNVIINGAMNVAQRGTSASSLGGNTSSTTSTRYKVCDRWGFEASGTDGRFTMTQDSSAPNGFANSLKLDCTTDDTSIAAGELLVLQQRIEGQNLQAFAKGTSGAKPFSLSFYAKANASKTYVAELFDIDNSRHVGKTFTVGTDWARHEITFPADTTGAFGDDNGRSLDFNIWLHGGATFTGGTLGTTWQAEDADDRAAGIGSFFSSTANTFFITGVQLEVGQNPTEFEHEPVERTLTKCQRYYQRWQANTAYDAVCMGQMNTDTFWVGQYKLQNDMRVEPTINADGTDFKVNASNGDMNASNIALNRATPQVVSIECNTTDSNRQGNGAFMRTGTDSDAFIEFKAEL
jgi:ribosome-associated translation inhibitor RaiA